MLTTDIGIGGRAPCWPTASQDPHAVPLLALGANGGDMARPGPQYNRMAFTEAAPCLLINSPLSTRASGTTSLGSDLQLGPPTMTTDMLTYSC